jgi:predicted transcriptional regulator
MQLQKVIEILEAEVICADNLELEILTACGSDMMSDALAYVKDQAMLLTGLLNPQTIRTAEMLDMHCVVFVRGKLPGEDIIELAKERGIALLSTKYRMFTACGRLYAGGLGGGCAEI